MPFRPSPLARPRLTRRALAAALLALALAACGSTEGDPGATQVSTVDTPALPAPPVDPKPAAALPPPPPPPLNVTFAGRQFDLRVLCSLDPSGLGHDYTFIEGHERDGTPNITCSFGIADGRFERLVVDEPAHDLVFVRAAAESDVIVKVRYRGIDAGASAELERYATMLTWVFGPPEHGPNDRNLEAALRRTPRGVVLTRNGIRAMMLKDDVWLLFEATAATESPPGATTPTAVDPR